MFRENRPAQTNGWSNVCSETGGGTTFRIYRPKVTETNGQQPEPAEPGPAPDGVETILIVEDNASVRASLFNALSQLGYRVLQAIDGGDACEVWRQSRDEIHLMLTDLVLPGTISGMELAAELLKERPRLKVIYTSGYGDGGDSRLQEGVNFLAKPFNTYELARIVRNRLDIQ